jgi:uncharacterized membrane protein
MRRAAIAAHVGLLIAVPVTIAGFALSLPLRALVAGILMLPLALTLPGLVTGRSASLRWLALALVLYCGFGCVEVIATGTPAAALTLLFALAELALVLMLIRRSGARSPDAATAP